jgi:apolipoprotein N-acyltransferase
MVHKKFIIASSLLYSVAFICPQFFFWTIYVYLIPLFYFSLKNKISFKDGFMWGLVFYSIHCLAIAVLVYTKIDAWLAPLAYSSLVLYFSMCSGLWFMMLGYAKRCNTMYACVACFSLITLFFNLFMCHYSLIVLGRLEGYPFACMLLPLAEYPRVLSAIPYSGEFFFMLYLITLQALAAAWLDKNKKCLPLIAVGWFLLLVPQRLQEEFPPIINKLGYIAPPPYPSTTGEVAQYIIHGIKILKKNHPEVEIICMPESTFRFPINEHKYLIKTISDNLIFKDLNLIFGGHRREKGKLYNSLHWIRSSLIMQSYDKQHLMLFGEILPYQFLNSFMRNISLFSIRNTFVRGESTSPIFHINSDFTFIGSICSELLFDHKKPEAHEYPILLITNDAWIEFTPHYQHLFFLLVRYKAILWQQPIIYVAHSGAWWIEKAGTTYTIS